MTPQKYLDYLAYRGLNGCSTLYIISMVSESLMNKHASFDKLLVVKQLKDRTQEGGDILERSEVNEDSSNLTYGGRGW